MKVFVTAVAGVALFGGLAAGAHAADRHVFYVHGCCVKDGSDPKAGDYETIVQKFKDSGFNVEYELRTADVGDNDAAVQAYAARIADRVNALLAKGVAPGSITVAGYSLGSMTSMVAAGLIANPKINVVLLAGCPASTSIPVTIDYAKVKGRVLSVTDKGDDRFGSCAGKFSGDNVFKEVAIDTGKGHAAFRIAKDKFIAQWMNPVQDWISTD